MPATSSLSRFRGVALLSCLLALLLLVGPARSFGQGTDGPDGGESVTGEAAGGEGELEAPPEDGADSWFGTVPEDVDRREDVEASLPDAASFESGPTGGGASSAEPAAGAVEALPTASSAPPLRLDERVVSIGRPPYMSLKDIMALVRGLLAFLRREMGVKQVRLVTAPDYAGVLSDLERGTIDFAWLGPTAYALGRTRMHLVPLAQARRRTGATYHGVLITRKDSGIGGIEDLRGRTIGFVDPESASGYLYPLYLLTRTGVDPHKVCRKVEFLRRHDAVLEAVLAGRVEAGVCLEDTLAVGCAPGALEQLLVLGQTDEVPSDVVVCRRDCHPVLRDKFKAALLKTATLDQTASGATGLPPIMVFQPADQTGLDAVSSVVQAIDGVRVRVRP